MMMDEPAKHHFKQYFEDVINATITAVQASGQAANVERSGSMDGFSIIVQPLGDDDLQTERLLTISKEALLDAASHSCVYVLGYCSPKPFTMQPQGFAATLGAMESPTSACWHLFKKGFCRHGESCCKQHPVCQVPIQVLVQSVQMNSSTGLAHDFKQQIAELAMTVTATLSQSPYAERAEAVKQKDDQGWTIEVVAKGSSCEELISHKEDLLSVAKEALFGATSISKDVYILGYAAKPFVCRSMGFVTMLGNMHDESKACWDLYSKGFCHRDCACRWEHPECLAPINVVVHVGGSNQRRWEQPNWAPQVFPQSEQVLPQSPQMQTVCNPDVFTYGNSTVSTPSVFLQPR